MTTRLDQIVSAAIAEGLLSQPDDMGTSNRRWSVVVMTGLVSWLISLPLLVLLALVFQPSSGGQLIMLSLPVICMAAGTLRIPSVLLPVEQMAVAGLMAGCIGLMIGITWAGGDTRLAFAVTGGVIALAALIVPQNWLRGLLGALATVPLILSATLVSYDRESNAISPWLAWHIAAGICLGGHALVRRFENNPNAMHRLILLEATLTGVSVMTLCGLAFDGPLRMVLIEKSGMLSWEEKGMPFGPPYGGHAFSVLCAIVAAGWIAHRWPALRKPCFLPVTAAAAALSWFLPSMGGMLLMLVACLRGGYRKLAVLAVIGLLWMTGEFYYYFHWPLVHKGLLLLGCAAALAGVARFGFMPMERVTPAAIPARETGRPWTRWLVAGGAVMTLAVANAGIWQKEALIRQGAPVFAELMPVDPRSLMQGDYMSLQVRMPDELRHTGRPRTLAVARREQNGIVTLLRQYDGARLAAGELLIELVQKDGWNVLASDAWFFAEGDGERWSRARYGEFRVAPDGQVLLVGLRGARLEKL